MTSTTKKDIVNTIAAQMQLKQSVVNEVVQRTFDAIIEVLLREQRVELRDFGVFKIRTRASRQARNPRTNARIVVPARTTVSFKPGLEMKRKIASSVEAALAYPDQPAAVARRAGTASRTARPEPGSRPGASSDPSLAP
jgi:nucleoid DNA-binding protein